MIQNINSPCAAPSEAGSEPLTHHCRFCRSGTIVVASQGSSQEVALEIEAYNFQELMRLIDQAARMLGLA